MFKSTKFSKLGLVVIAAMMLALVAFAPAASAHGLKGKTTLTLDPGAAAALTSLGVSVAPVAPATAGPDGISFPITGVGGGFFPPALKINHSGGLSFTAGATTLALTDYTINLGRSPVLIASAGSARVTILKLDTSKARFKYSWSGLKLGPIKASLTADAATALNTTFGVTAFTEGLVLGTATVSVSR